MIEAINLLWIIPLSALFGFLIAALMYSAANEGNEEGRK